MGSIGNDINRELSNFGNGINKELDTFMNGAPPEKPDFSSFNGISDKWYGLADKQTGQQYQKNLGDIAQSANAGMQTGLGALAQRGGINTGTRERLASNSIWNQMNLGNQASQAANMNKTDMYQKGIMGIDLPIAQGKDAAMAQYNAQRAARPTGLQNAMQIGSLVTGFR